MDFSERLGKAVQRGRSRAADVRGQAAAEAQSEEELRRLHTNYRLDLSEHIEECLARLPDHFPGFEFQRIADDSGWGAAAQRDDIQITGGHRENYFSRVELVIRPPGQYMVLDLAGKATVRNKEIFRRNHFQQLAEVDLHSFVQLIDNWTLEFAECYAAEP